MGTSALTKINDFDGKTIITMYRQSDGYQDCHGKELKDFLSSKKLVNGIPVSFPADIANGMGCLSAQLVANLKTKVGLHYLYPSDEKNDWVDFCYTVYPTDSSARPTLSIKVESFGDVLFDGLISEYEAIDECDD